MLLVGAPESSATIYGLKTSIISYSSSERVHWANVCRVGGRLPLKCDSARAETRFRLSAKRTSPFLLAWGVSLVDYWQPRCSYQR